MAAMDQDLEEISGPVLLPTYNQRELASASKQMDADPQLMLLTICSSSTWSIRLRRGDNEMFVEYRAGGRVIARHRMAEPNT